MALRAAQSNASPCTSHRSSERRRGSFAASSVPQGVKGAQDGVLEASRGRGSVNARDAHSPIREEEDAVGRRSREPSPKSPTVQSPVGSRLSASDNEDGGADSDNEPLPVLPQIIPDIPVIEPLGPAVRLPTAMKALQTELNVLQRELDESTCKIELVDSDLFNWEVALRGPDGSPYQRGIFRFLLYFPADYPRRMPRIRCATPVYHCNIDQSGSVCLGPFDEDGLHPKALVPRTGPDAELSTCRTALRIVIVGARGLRNADNMGTSDPYCTCQVPGKDWSKFQTAVIDNALNPVWNEEHMINDYVAGDPLEFQVLDDDDGKDESKDDKLGRATLESRLFYPEGFDGELTLQDTGKTHRTTLRVKVSVVTPRRQHDRATALDIVEALLSLLTLPILRNPLNPAAARLFEQDRRQHDRIARDWTLRHAL